MQYRNSNGLLKKANRRREELPSFLLKLTSVPEEIELPTKTTKSDVYLGSLFFGVCKGYHPPHHGLNLEKFKLVQHIVPSRETFLENLRLKKENLVELKPPTNAFQLRKPRNKKLYDDPYPHKCLGKLKRFTPEWRIPEIDLGETTSKIEGETSREIRYYHLKSISSRTSQDEIEVVTLSDIREKNRAYMSPNERAAHSHFPKEFVTVDVYGPKIPASLTIKKIPSKRRKLSDYGYQVITTLPELTENEEEEEKQEEEEEEEEEQEQEGENSNQSECEDEAEEETINEEGEGISETASTEN